MRKLVKSWLLPVTFYGLTLGATQAAIQLGDVPVASIGHVFTQPQAFSPAMLRPRVTDYLVDQRQLGHGGAQMPPVTVNFDTDHQFILTLTAPPGQKFWVHVPAGQLVRFGGGLDWQAPPGQPIGPSEFGTTTVSLGNLEGTAPGYYAARACLSQMHGFFGFNDLQSLSFTNDIAFTSITLTGTVPSTQTGSGAVHYLPAGDNALVFYYTTTLANDPGAFVSLVPIAQPLMTAGSALVNLAPRSN